MNGSNVNEKTLRLINGTKIIVILVRISKDILMNSNLIVFFPPRKGRKLKIRIQRLILIMIIWA